MKKRLISILFILCLTVALSLSVSAESNKLTYAVGASAPTVSANTEFTILVEVTENTGICWLKAVVTYDSSVLTYVGASSDTSVFKDATITVNNTYSNNKGTAIVVAGTMGVLFDTNPRIYTATGTFVELTFKVDPNAPVGTTSIKVETEQGDALKIVGGKADTEYTINSATTNIKIVSSDHTCTPGEPVKENIKDATCTEIGSYDSVTYCTVCKAVISKSVVVIPLNDKHTPGEAVIENQKNGDCKNPGTHDSVVYCTSCHKEVSRTKVTSEKGTHVAGAPEVVHNPSTCLKKGSIVEITKCSVCGTEISRNTTELELSDHIPGSSVRENVIEATCTATGSHTSVVYCSVCKTKLSSENVTVPKVSHNAGTPVKENEFAATCQLGGHYDLVTYCTMCKSVMSKETKVTEKIEHIRGNAVKENEKKPVNCAADGSYESVVYCTMCKAELSRVTQAIKAPAHTPGPDATETAPQICTVCNTVIAPAKGHTHKWATAWTSDAVGHWYACSGCSEKKSYEAHHYANACDSDCNICGAVNSSAGHNYSNDCDDTCNKCGEKRQIVGHAYDNDCDGTCNTCGEVRVTAHKYDSVCDADCNVCGEKRTPADHVYGNWKTVTEATETTDGKRERTCIVCAFVESEVIPATGSDVTTDGGDVTVDTDVTTDPGTDNTDPTGTEPVVTDPENSEDETEPDVIEDNGCGSVVSAGIAIIAILGSAIILKKRD